MKRTTFALLTLALYSATVACGHGHDHDHDHADVAAGVEATGDVAGGVEATADAHGADDGHAEVSLGKAMLGELEVELAQGHGAVAAGKESHLVVKLPYSDGGSSVVRAWIGTEDRTASYVGKGQYAADHDDYDLHVSAPDPLPENPMWWIELVQPDGTKIVGSAQPIL